MTKYVWIEKEGKLKIMPKYVWINKEGKFLYISEVATHTGSKKIAYFTPDLNLASVEFRLPRFTDGTDVASLTPLEVEVTRIVTLKPPQLVKE